MHEILAQPLGTQEQNSKTILNSNFNSKTKVRFSLHFIFKEASNSFETECCGGFQKVFEFSEYNSISRNASQQDTSLQICRNDFQFLFVTAKAFT